MLWSTSWSHPNSCLQTRRISGRMFIEPLRTKQKKERTKTSWSTQIWKKGSCVKVLLNFSSQWEPVRLLFAWNHCKAITQLDVQEALAARAFLTLTPEVRQDNSASLDSFHQMHLAHSGIVVFMQHLQKQTMPSQPSYKRQPSIFVDKRLFLE